jgi:hypothetical protein
MEKIIKVLGTSLLVSLLGWLAIALFFAINSLVMKSPSSGGWIAFFICSLPLISVAALSWGLAILSGLFKLFTQPIVSRVEVLNTVLGIGSALMGLYYLINNKLV